ncbi:MAG: hypothetical protein HYY18_03500 [Planctomycetes bacterium]|nr:hypothetical protein [Planctomycetota bacterium]
MKDDTGSRNESELLSRGSYKGKPLFVVANVREPGRLPFQFGPYMASLLKDAMDAIGPEKFRDRLAEFVRENKESSTG